MKKSSITPNLPTESVLQSKYSKSNAAVDSVRNYYGGRHPEAKEGVGIHIEQGPDGGVVTLDDTTILDAAMRILNEK